MASTITQRKLKATTGKSPKQDTSTTTDNDSSANPRWTFLTNHSHVLVLLHSNPDIVLRQVASAVGITERAVQRIIQDLESGGVIERERIGRRNHYKVLIDKPLRHAIEAHRNIGDLLALISKDE
jgi:DNA-binding MarR family transcriptional regulator